MSSKSLEEEKTVAKNDNPTKLEAFFARVFSSSNMTFLMVLLNGLILTGTAFLILSVFISEMRQEETRRTLNTFRQTLEDSFLDMDSQIVSTSSIIKLRSEGFTLSDFQETLEKMSYVLGTFDHVAWIHNDENKWIASNFSIHNDLKYNARITDTEIQKLIGHIKLTKASTLLLPGFVNDQTFIENEDPFVSVKPLTLATVLRDENDRVKDIVLYTARLSNVIRLSNMQHFEEISRLRGRVEGTNQELVTIDKDRQARSEGKAKSTGVETFLIPFGNTILKFDMNIVSSGRNAFLNLVPYLMLTFGAVITLIGSLYVRNNQKQAHQFGNMNKALAAKNKELNDQVLEKERLFQTLRRAENENRAIINAVSDIIFEIDETGTLIFINDSWTDVTGRKVEKSLQQNLMDLLHPSDVDEVKSGLNSLLDKSEDTLRIFTSIRTLDGKFRSVEMTMSILRKDENKSYKIVGTMVDIEERRRAEKALVDAEKKYRNIVQHASAGIYQATPEGQFVSVNNALAKILGYNSTDAVKEDITSITKQLYLDPTERHAFVAKLERDGEVSNYEVRLKRKDGTHIWVKEDARIVKDENGETLFFEGSLEDITQRKEAEIGLIEAKQQSDLANRAKSEFLANMSHELRTPLNAIIGFSEIIKNEVFGPVGRKEYWEYSNDIFESGKRLLTVINEILDVSKIEAGERQLNEGILDIQKVLDACLGLQKAKAEAAGLDLQLNISKDIPKVIGEELAMKQIFMNILSNSIKFTPSGGHITITDDIDGHGNLNISITDTGIGIDPHDIDKAISPFGQIDNSLSRNNSGTGLGLTLVRALMNLHGGHIDIVSQKGVGTTVTLVIPARRVAKTDGDASKALDEAQTKSNDNVVKI